MRITYRHGAKARVRSDLSIKRAHALSHDVFCLAKPYADQLLCLERRGICPEAAMHGEHLQLNVYATEAEVLPEELLWDHDINWHGQQHGRAGLIAAAGLWLPADLPVPTAMVTLLQSDLATQVGKHPTYRPRYKGRIDSALKRWCALLLNALLDLCVLRGVRRLLIPTSESILRHILKPVHPLMFERVYDLAPRRYRCRPVRLEDSGLREAAAPEGHGYWALDPQENLDRLLPLEFKTWEVSRPERSICICHDTEESVDTDVSDELCRDHLERMLEVERSLGARATYAVLGSLFPHKVERIGRSGPHALAFHSYDHDIDRLDQLPRVREQDLQVKGYRPPQSKLTPELSEERLLYYNFEWLASSAHSLGGAAPHLSNGMAKLPILTDDWPLHRGASGTETYERWRDGVLGRIERTSTFAGLGLHDCYASTWIDRYPDFLDQLSALGSLETMDEVASRLFLASSTEEQFLGSSPTP